MATSLTATIMAINSHTDVNEPSYRQIIPTDDLQPLTIAQLLYVDVTLGTVAVRSAVIL